MLNLLLTFRTLGQFLKEKGKESGWKELGYMPVERSYMPLEYGYMPEDWIKHGNILEDNLTKEGVYKTERL